MMSIFREVILQNELGGDISLAYKFSDADGVRTGKSGWSFGLCQFDTQHSSVGRLCLLQIGFLPEEMLGICHQQIDIGPMNAKLLAARDRVDSWDNTQLEHCLTHVEALCQDPDIELANRNVLLYLGDYHNQMYMAPYGKLHMHLKSLGWPIVAQDILDFKLRHTLWGEKRPDDCTRRHENITRLTA